MTTDRQPERRFLPLELAELRQAGEETQRQIHGYGAIHYDGTPKTEFRMGRCAAERIMPGAFAESIGSARDVISTWNHDPSRLLGRTSARTLRLASDERGVRYEVDVPDTAVGRDLLVSIERRDVAGSSVMFLSRDDRWIKEDGVRVREITRAILLDIGPATMPAYEATEAWTRSADYAELRRSLEAFDRAEEEEVRARDRESIEVRRRLFFIAGEGWQ